MPRGQNFGKRKFGGSHSNSSEYFMSPKNQRRPCREIIYTEDHIPVRKLYFCVATADVSFFPHFFKRYYKISITRLIDNTICL